MQRKVQPSRAFARSRAEKADDIREILYQYCESELGYTRDNLTPYNLVQNEDGCWDFSFYVKDAEPMTNGLVIGSLDSNGKLVEIKGPAPVSTVEWLNEQVGKCMFSYQDIYELKQQWEPKLDSIPEKDMEFFDSIQSFNPILDFLRLDIVLPDEQCIPYEEAKQNPAEENVFRQLRLDQWVGSTVAWIPEHVYDKGDIPIDMEKLKGRDCYAGLDLSSTSDITAFVMVFPPEAEGENYIVLPHFWLPRETLQLRVRRDHVPYDVWEKQGLFHITEGNVVDYNFVRKTINELGTEYHICEIGVDRWNATQLITDLDGDGFVMVPIGMGFKDMSPGMKELYKLLLEGKITHGGNPILRWMAGNVVAEIDAAENIKPSKKKATEKIDGIVALIMGLDRCIRHEMTGSVYDDPDHGLLVF